MDMKDDIDEILDMATEVEEDDAELIERARTQTTEREKSQAMQKRLKDINESLTKDYAENKTALQRNKSLEVYISRNSIINDYYRVMPLNLYKAINKADFSKLELKVVLYLLNQTVGFYHNVTDYFVSAYHIAEEIGGRSDKVKKALKRLEQKNVIWRHEAAFSKNGVVIYRYYFNQRFDSWDIQKKVFVDFVEQEIENQPQRLQKRKQEIAEQVAEQKKKAANKRK